MGAAQLLQSLTVEPRFCAVAAESPFSSFREIGYDRAGQFFYTGPWLGRTLLCPALTFAFWFGKKDYGLDLTQVSPQVAVAHTRVPVLLIHGRDDSNIPVRHSHLLAAANSEISLWEVPDADHCGAISTAPGEFSARLLAWFARSSATASTLKSAI